MNAKIVSAIFKTTLICSGEIFLFLKLPTLWM